MLQIEMEKIMCNTNKFTLAMVHMAELATAEELHDLLNHIADFELAKNSKHSLLNAAASIFYAGQK